jgi:uncharacterized protein YjbI with pentapeptide repeats
MRTKNLTPFPVGKKLTSRRPPQREMMLAVRGRLRLRPGEPLRALEGLLDQGPMSGEVFADEDEERAGEALYPDDFADFKLRADVLLKATCHPPGGRAATECPVRFSVGAWSKTLRVFGRRVWTEKLVGHAISDPAPFAVMPLVWSNAFGGPTLATNPVGKGVGTPELPTVEVPSALLRAKGDRPPPGSFGPVSSAWPQRAGKVGKEYGEAYRKKRAPFHAEDFDWTYFNAAPPDQQIDGYLRGDEELTFTNLHPEASSFSATLPGLRLRAVVKNVKGEIAGVRMVLDTLFADLEEGVLSLTWRGLTPVEEDDLQDVQTVLVASEPLAEAPLPLDRYVARLEAYERDPLGRDEILTPEMKKAMAAGQELGEPPRPGEPPKPVSAVVRALLADQLGELPPDERAQVEGALAQADEMMAKAEEARRQTANDVKNAPTARAKQAAAMRGLVERAKALKEMALARGLPSESVDELDKLLADPAVAKVLIPSTEEPGPGKDFAGQDLSEEDLSGRDLRGASFEGARLLKTKLAGSCLAGCNLRRAMLAEADLTGADLSGADLTEAVLLGARAAGANLSRTTLAKTLFDRADLTGATFESARGELVAFSSAILSRVNFRGAVFHKVLAMGAPLDRADFTGADLAHCLFVEMKAEGLLLERARIERTSFARSDLRGAKVTDAHGQGSIWTGATLDGADFSFAVLPDAQLSEASAKGTLFFGADLRGARFYRAVLDGAQLFHANLARADLNKASLNATVFREANLYDAKLLGAAGANCDLEDAYTARARFEGA